MSDLNKTMSEQDKVHDKNHAANLRQTTAYLYNAIANMKEQIVNYQCNFSNKNDCTFIENNNLLIKHFEAQLLCINKCIFELEK
jgi:hypothetical protein